MTDQLRMPIGLPEPSGKGFYECPECHHYFKPKTAPGGYQRYCGAFCRERADKRDVRDSKRIRHARAILARLRLGPAKTSDLVQITHRFSARIHELREDHKIKTEGRGDDALYTLEE